MSPLVFIGFYVLVCVAAFALGLRVFRSARPPEGVTVAQARRFGRLLMMVSAMLLLFLTAAWAHGDLKAVRL
jgi:hypothetical protein